MTSDFEQMAKQVNNLRDNLEDEHERATEDAMSDMRGMVQGEIRKQDSVARGVLVSDVRATATTNYETFVEQSVHVPEWAKYLEHGTGQRGQRDVLPDGETYAAPDPVPPIEHIITWIVEKGITPTEYDTVYGLASAIQDTIGMVGTFAHPFLRTTWWGPFGYQHVIDANVNAMSRALRRSI